MATAQEPWISIKMWFFLLWITWLTTGTLYYAYDLELTIARGFYMAVNVGYSIGWGDIPEAGNLSSQWFSTGFVLVGSSFVAAALGFFAASIVEDKDNWYVNEVQRIRYEDYLIKHKNNAPKRWYRWLKYNYLSVRSIALWILFVASATLASWYCNKEFNFINALYFAVSSLSTGGLYALPPNSPDWSYGLTGFYSAVGVPLMGIAMATFASFFIDTGSIDSTIEAIRAPVDVEEVAMLTEFGIADDDGEIDKAEFIILCMVRTGAATPELIRLMVEHFNFLDDDNSGALSLEEITQKVSAAADNNSADLKQNAIFGKLSKMASKVSKRRRASTSGNANVKKKFNYAGLDDDEIEINL